MVGLEKRSLSLERRYAGTYVSAGTDAERAAVKAAVDSATDGWGSPQGFARSALMKRSEIRPTYTISFDDKGVVSVVRAPPHGERVDRPNVNTRIAPT